MSDPTPTPPDESKPKRIPIDLAMKLLEKKRQERDLPPPPGGQKERPKRRLICE